jgi:hypothetical protein
MKEKIINLLSTGEEHNIQLAYQVASGQGLVQSIINDFEHSLAIATNSNNMGRHSKESIFYFNDRPLVSDEDYFYKISSIITMEEFYARRLPPKVNFWQFSSLKAAFLDNNPSLKYLDVSNNLSLKTLHICNCSLQEIDLTNTVSLKTLYCNGNNLREIDLSKNINLVQLQCCSNSLNELDLSNNADLHYVWCADNNLKELDLSNNDKLMLVDCTGNNIDSIELPKSVKEAYLDRNTKCNQNTICRRV